MSIDIVFYTHANNNTGFGHAARCAKIAKIINRISPSLKIGFFGEFTPSAKKVVTTLCDPVFLDKPDALVGVYDRMDQHINPEIWSHGKLAYLKQRCQKVIFMANGRKVPDVPSDITVIGYKITSEIVSRSNCHWGLEYTPVDVSLKDNTYCTAPDGQLFLALGGGQGNALTKKALIAVNNIDEILGINVLLSPVNPISLNFTADFIKKPITPISNVSDLTSIIVSSKVVLASYGHLAYEALALQVPVCLVAQKKFQADYAAVLDKNNFCIFAGSVDTLSIEDIEKGIRKALMLSEELVLNASKRILSGGLERIAQIIIKKTRV